MSVNISCYILLKSENFADHTFATCHERKKVALKLKSLHGCDATRLPHLGEKKLHHPQGMRVMKNNNRIYMRNTYIGLIIASSIPVS